MQVILLKDIEKLGDRFDVVNVKPGYGRNYLIPQGFAQVANKGNMEKLDEIKAREAALEAQRSAEYKALIAKLEAQSLTIGAKAGASGKIFGSVTNVQIAAAIMKPCQRIVATRPFMPRACHGSRGSTTARASAAGHGVLGP
ncbi:MAG: 50S ribosomal protein L9, partial [Haliscomenobacter sp.]